jgi:hypothetical protein
LRPAGWDDEGRRGARRAAFSSHADGAEDDKLELNVFFPGDELGHLPYVGRDLIQELSLCMDAVILEGVRCQPALRLLDNDVEDLRLISVSKDAQSQVFAIHHIVRRLISL